MDLESRRAAIDLLGHLRGEQQPKVLLNLLGTGTARPIQIASARAIANRDDAALLGQVFADWQRGRSIVVRQDLLDAIARTPVGVPAVLAAVAEEHLTAIEIPNQIRDAALQHRDAAIREQASKLLSAAVTADRNEVISRYSSIVTQRGNSKAGAALFKQHCLTCHAVRGVGQRVGPDLAGVSSRRRDVLLVDILDPSRQLSPDYKAYSLVTRQGRVFTGMIAAETADSVTIRREKGEQDTILRPEIEVLRGSNKSVMPDGFETKLSSEQLADVLEFLSHPDTKLLTGE